MKLAVIYDSKTGNTKQAADWIVEGMKEVNEVEALAFSINEVDEEFVKASRGIVIGSPSYAAAMTPD
nr:flavodoxin family protein [Lachnospiraceae bacterium]